MKKNKLNIEIELNSASLNVLWNSISTALGLAEWFAEVVTVKENEYTFCWDENEQTALLIHSKLNNYVRFQWEEDSGSDYYFEFKITSLEITEDLALVITDFAEAGEKDDLVLLWNKQIEILRRKTGI